MKIKIVFITFFFGMCALNAYAQNYSKGPSYDKHMQIVNQQLDQIEGIAPAQIAKKRTRPQVIPTNNLNNYENSFSINYHTFYSRYSEPQKTRTISGVWDGVEGKYIFRPLKNNFFDTSVFNFYAIEGLYAKGNNKMNENEQRASDGSITKLAIKNIPGYMFENRFLLGRDYMASPSIRLTPYTGLGIRYKTDHSAGHYDVFDNFLGSPVVALGYNFSDLYYYIPIGLTLDMEKNKEYEFSSNIEYDYLVKGYERDDYSNFDQFTLPADGFTNQNLRYSLNHGWGLRSSIKILKHLKLSDIYFEPYIRYWHISASRVASGSVGGGDYMATANKNTSLEVGSSVGIKFY